MMLSGDFFTFKMNYNKEGLIKGRINFNKDHNIFKGHFPKNPIVPGVCQIQAIKEIAEYILDKNFMLTRARNIKFISIINPVETPFVYMELSYEFLEDNELDINCTLILDDKVFLKFRGTFSE